MAAAFVQTATQSSSGGTASLGVTLASPATQGNLVVVHVRIVGTASVTSVTDDKGNTYVIGSALGLPTANQSLYQAYGVQVTGGATTITVTLSTSIAVRLGADEYSGTAASNAAVADQSSTGTGSGSSLAVSSFSPSATGLLIVACGNIAASPTWTAGSGYVLASGSGSVAMRSQYKLSGAASETAPMTTSLSTEWAEIARSYKLAASPHGRPLINAGLIETGLLNAGLVG